MERSGARKASSSVGGTDMEEKKRKTTASPIKPNLLYHYTTLDGLLGILEKSEIWATGIRFLNDTSEYEAGLKAVFALMNSELSGSPGESVVGKYAPLIRQSAEYIFTASFSKEPTGDDLSQWRTYGGEHSGVSLGFSPQYIRRIARHFLKDKKDSGWIGTNEDPLIKCKYYKDRDYFEDNEEIKKKIAEIVALEEESTKALSFARYAAALKHERFKAEKELRILLVQACGKAPEAVKFRRVKSLVVPYVCIRLAWDGQPIEIDRIVVGPTPHKEQAKQSIEMLLKSYRVTFKDVVESKIPYRNW
jgi:hypothetical protein